MTYTDLLTFMDSGDIVQVTTKDRHRYEGQCWAYNTEVSKAQFGFEEPCLDIGSNTVLKLSEIEKIEFAERDCRRIG